MVFLLFRTNAFQFVIVLNLPVAYKISAGRQQYVFLCLFLCFRVFSFDSVCVNKILRNKALLVTTATMWLYIIVPLLSLAFMSFSPASVCGYFRFFFQTFCYFNWTDVDVCTNVTWILFNIYALEMATFNYYNSNCIDSIHMYASGGTRSSV